MIILDEVQDITPLYYEFVCKFIKDSNEYPKMCILGDKFQTIYNFLGSDEKFISMAEHVFNYNKMPWKRLKLSESFRVPIEHARFLNTCMLKEERIVSRKISDKCLKPRYIFCDAYAKRPFIEVEHYLSEGYLTEEIFIIAPSIKNSKSPVKVLANLLSENKYPVFIPSSDEEKIEEDMITNKIVFATFHQIKGLERKVIICYGVDDGYYKYNAQKSSTFECPNPIYVGLTRSLEHCSIIHHQENSFMDFMNTEQIQELCWTESIDEVRRNKSFNLSVVGNWQAYPVNNIFEYFGTERKRIVDIVISKFANKDKKITQDVSVTDLCRNLSGPVIDGCMRHLVCKTLRKVNTKKHIGIPYKIKNGIMYEPVSDITGIAIPAFHELKHTDKMEIYESIRNVQTFTADSGLAPKSVFTSFIDEDSDLEDGGLVSSEDTIHELMKDISKGIDNVTLLKLANVYNSYTSCLMHKINQIETYDWLSNENLNRAVERLDDIIKGDATYEFKISVAKLDELQNKKINGFIDCVNGNNIYEFKCTDSLTSVHKIQLAIYMFMYMNRQSHLMDLFPSPHHHKSIIELMNDRDFLIESNHIYDEASKHDELKNGPSFPNNDVMINWCEKCIYEEIDILCDTPYKFILYNILSDEMIQVCASFTELRLMIKELIYNKFFKENYVPEGKFIENCMEVKNKYRIREF
jgi:hypothetical protein